MHFSESDTFCISKNSHKKQMKNSPGTNNRNVHFYTLGPLVWKWVEVQYSKSILTFIQCQGSLCSKIGKILYLELKLSHGNHSCLQTDRQQRQCHKII